MWRAILFAAVCVAFLYLFFTVGFPFLLALVIAILLEPLVQLSMKYNKANRLVASTLVCTLFTLVMLGIGYGLGVKIITETSDFIKKITEGWSNSGNLVQDTNDRLQSMLDFLSPTLVERISASIHTALTSLSGILKSVSSYALVFAKQLPNVLIFLLVFIVSLFLYSIQMPKLKQSFLSFFEDRTRTKMESVLETLRNAVFGFIVAMLILGGITFVEVLAGLLLLGVPYALAISFLIVLVDVLPILGAGSVLVPWAIYCFYTGDNSRAIGLLILFGVVTIVRRVIEPKILGNAVGIGALASLASLYIGFKLFGGVGLFLGPVIVILFKAFHEVGLFNHKIKL